MARAMWRGGRIMSLVNDPGWLSQERRDSQLIGLRREANRCWSFAACVSCESTRVLLEGRAAEYERQVHELEAPPRADGAAAVQEIAVEEFA